ncbi:uncharacterized protein NPIL_75931 [Nephila pilipes]|uniref:DUF5641 domain-containing protein n=1 Tax=Nephila pilipes TaxID=299642 RepID=A0A8X6UNI4_NEPPI|nr:uncharacterized protein NPIL_75931 [Nephila pilipes]
MVNLARTGFAYHQNPRRKKFQNEQLKQSGGSSTASALVSLQKPGKKDCIFCDKSHPSEKCYLAKKMTLTAKQKLLLEKGTCFSCLKIAGRISKFCNVKNQLKCPKCNNHHFELMCTEPRKINEPKSFVPRSENSLSNCSRSETVSLQTLCVLIRCQGQEKIIRAVIDSDSQSSYVSQKIMTQLKGFPLRTETVIHALFGGDETEPKSHKVFAIEKIVFADFFREETDINLLIGADVLGKLLIENTVVLECGLTAVETKLEWTVFGKGSCRIGNILPSLSMHSISLKANKLWELEVLGISSENEKEKDDFNLKDFNDKIKILSDGRYEDLRQRFRKEYLGQLVQKHNEKQSRNPQIGEIVLIGDDNKKRLFWPLAKIIELIPGRNGKIRTVKLKTQHGTVLRPIQRIYPLEIYSKESVDGELGGEESNSNNVTDNENNVTSADDVIVRKFTSSGRPVKPPTRLDLLNNVCYTLETLSESQGGGECCETQ